VQEEITKEKSDIVESSDVVSCKLFPDSSLVSKNSSGPFSDNPDSLASTSHTPLFRASRDCRQGTSDKYTKEFRTALRPILSELEQVESSIRQELLHRHALHSDRLAEMLAYTADLGGKRLRPCLLLLAAKTAGRVTDESIRLAIVVELIHTATLVHDDVLDGALTRRHKQCLHQRWTVPASVLIGDWLFAHAYGLANQGDSTIPGRWIAEAAKLVCQGEIAQGNSIGNFSISVEDYLRMIEGKTGALCAVSCALGTWSGGGNASDCERMKLFGLKLGTAFQVIDDWFDLWGNEDKEGKTLGSDLNAFKPTLPAIHALSRINSFRKDEFLLRLNLRDGTVLEELRNAIYSSDASDYTLHLASTLIEQAIQSLEGLPNIPAVTALKQLAAMVIERTGPSKLQQTTTATSDY
jgi:octaprenyl-diphosphate synthase